MASDKGRLDIERGDDYPLLLARQAFRLAAVYQILVFIECRRLHLLDPGSTAEKIVRSVLISQSDTNSRSKLYYGLGHIAYC